MSEGKTYVFGNDSGNNGMLSLLAPLLQKQGIDPSVLLAMMNNRDNGFGGEGGWFIWVIFLFFLMGWGGNGWGFGNRGNEGSNGTNGTSAADAALANLITNNDGRDLLMQAINGNNAAVSQLASTLNCSIGQVQTAINSLMGNIQQVANAVGQSSLQVINAVQSGNASIASQIAQCCCDNRLAIIEQTGTISNAINSIGTSLERGFASSSYETQRQTCDITNAITASTAQILTGQKNAEMRELQRDIAERDRRISEQAVAINNGQQTAIFSQMISQATAPIVNAITSLQADVNSFKCKLPETVSVPYPQLVGVPAPIAAQAGLTADFGYYAYNLNKRKD